MSDKDEYELSGLSIKDWEEEANEVARQYAPQILDCKKCGHPYAEGFCCSNCGDPEPDMPETENFTVYLKGTFTSTIQVDAHTYKEAVAIARDLSGDTLITDMDDITIGEVEVDASKG